MNLFQIAENFLRTFFFFSLRGSSTGGYIALLFPQAPRGLNRELYKLVY